MHFRIDIFEVLSGHIFQKIRKALTKAQPFMIVNIELDILVLNQVFSFYRQLHAEMSFFENFGTPNFSKLCLLHSIV